MQCKCGGIKREHQKRVMGATFTFQQCTTCHQVEAPAAMIRAMRAERRLRRRIQESARKEALA